MKMVNIGNFLFGILMLSGGILVFVYLTRERMKGDKGGYGNHTEMYTAAVTMLIIGLLALIKELIK